MEEAKYLCVACFVHGDVFTVNSYLLFEEVKSISWSVRIKGSDVRC